MNVRHVCLACLPVISMPMLPAIACKPASAHRGGGPPPLALFYSNDYQTTLCPSLKHLWGVSCTPGGFQTYRHLPVEPSLLDCQHSSQDYRARLQLPLPKSNSWEIQIKSYS